MWQGFDGGARCLELGLDGLSMAAVSASICSRSFAARCRSAARRCWARARAAVSSSIRCREPSIRSQLPVISDALVSVCCSICRRSASSVSEIAIERRRLGVRASIEVRKAGRSVGEARRFAAQRRTAAA